MLNVAGLNDSPGDSASMDGRAAGGGSSLRPRRS